MTGLATSLSHQWNLSLDIWLIKTVGDWSCQKLIIIFYPCRRQSYIRAIRTIIYIGAYHQWHAGYSDGISNWFHQNSMRIVWTQTMLKDNVVGHMRCVIDLEWVSRLECTKQVPDWVLWGWGTFVCHALCSAKILHVFGVTAASVGRTTFLND